MTPDRTTSRTVQGGAAMARVPTAVPTRRLLVAAAVGPAATILVMVIALDYWFLGLGYVAALVFLTVYDARSGFLAPHISLVANAPDALHMGREGAFIVELTGDQRGGGVRVECIVDVDDKIAQPSVQTVTLDAAGHGQIRAPLFPLRRGEAVFEAAWLRWAGPLGLTWRVVRYDLSLHTPILPDLPGVRRAALALDRRGARIGVKQQLAQGAGSEFEALRDFAPGLDRRSIDWKHSARYHKLIAKEYRIEQNHNLILAIDCGHVMREPIDGAPKLDHAINAALLLAYQALREGDRVGIYGFDAEPRVYLPPRAGRESFARVQRTLSELEYSLKEPNFTFSFTRLMTELRQPSIIIVLSDFLESVSAELMVEIIPHLARRHLTLFAALDDPSFQAMTKVPPSSREDLIRSVAVADILRERATVLERLRRNRVDAFSAAPQMLDAALVSRYAAIKERATATRV